MVTSAATAHRMALGTAQWGGPYGIANRLGPPSPSGIEEMIDVARSAGIDTLDTAHAYGRSEEVVGGALPRGDRWTVVTKLRPDLSPETAGRAEALRRAEASLRMSCERLGLETLPIVLLHRARHRTVCAGAIWRFLLDRREAGQIGQLGVSAGSPEEAAEALGDPDVGVIQVAANLLDQRLVRDGFFENARCAGKVVHVRSVFLQGVAHLPLDGLPPYLEGLRRPLVRMRAYAHELGRSLDELFLLFARDLPVHRVVVGCESPGQLRANLQNWERPNISVEPRAELAEMVAELECRLLDPALWPTSATPKAAKAGAR